LNSAWLHSIATLAKDIQVDESRLYVAPKISKIKKSLYYWKKRLFQINTFLYCHCHRQCFFVRYPRRFRCTDGIMFLVWMLFFLSVYLPVRRKLKTF